jgi:prolyl-tRNA editing enzyme YbaK/EbsC (Cys-tRNA(Pro) deacylase)
LGCRVEQIVKSLVFMTKKTKKPILVIASGANRVNTKKIRNLLSEPIKMAAPDFVRAKTGFAIGGVPPLGHSNPLETFIDEDLLKHTEIWAAAGTSNTMFKLSPDDLQKITEGQVISVT